jgi:hypothetical protein
MSSNELAGVVISSSRLPRSRSRTIATAVNIIMVIDRITPIRAGTICTAVRFSGLYSVRTSNSAEGRSYIPDRDGIGIAVKAHAMFSIVGSLPSTRSCAIGRSRSRRRRSKSAGM